MDMEHNMQNLIPAKSILFGLLCSAAFASPVQAQQLVSEWSPIDDGYGSGEETNEAPAAAIKRGVSSGPRVTVTPYIEAQQVLVADLRDGGEVLTYTTVAAGIDASIQTRRAEGQINARYERLIAYDDGVASQDNISGLARGLVRVAPGLSLEAGGIATRSKIDGRGASPTNLVGNPDNVTQIYSVYAGPTLTTQVAGVDLSAAYRAGYTKVESRDAGALPTGQDPIGIFDDSISHIATASVGQQPGRALPIGWSVGAGYQREDAGELDNRLEGKYVRGDVTVPISGGLAVVGGIGYENIKISERDALRNGAGAPITDANGRFVTDPASPRLTAYQEDGLIWDAGVMWRPSSRTSVSGYYGQRYGSDTFGANLSYQPNNRWAVNLSVYDQVTGFGSLLNNNLANLPTNFRAARNPLSGDISSCAFSQAGGFCFNDALQTASSASFRSRGGSAAFSSQVAGWDTGIAIGYDRRKFLVSALGARADLAGLVDQNYYVLAYLGTNIDNKSRFDASFYGNYFDPGFIGADNVLGLGANAAVYRQIIRGLSASAAIGIDSSRQENFDSQLTGSALLGLRYSF
jgi:hypothetical protein